MTVVCLHICVLVDTLVNIGKQVLQERNADVSKAR